LDFQSARQGNALPALHFFQPSLLISSLERPFCFGNPRAMNSQSRPASSNFRWIICSLLFFSTTVNYMDRQVISYLKEFFCTATSAGGFGWSNSDFANVTSAFTGFYAGMTILAGYVIDKIGTKIGLALSLIIWSIFGILNAFIGSATWMHMIVRSLFGIGEAGNFPASIKTVAEWFPKRERALATGIFNSGSNVGAMISALFVPWCLIHFGDQSGWKMAYILTGTVGFLWLIFWFWLYNPPTKCPQLSQAEYDHIHSDKDEAQSAQTSAASVKKNPGIFSFTGRVPVAAFWGMSIMIAILCLFIYFITIKIVPDALHNQPTVIFFSVVGVIALWALLALHTKRWHDLGKSGWLALLNFIPGLGTLISIFALGFRHGNSADNEFGSASGPGLLGCRPTWSFFVGKFMTDGVWWFYLFWLPDYLKKQFGMDKHQIMLPTFIVYGIAIIGSVYGGSVPMTLMKRGMQVYKARMTAMFLIAIFPLTVLATQYFGNVAQFGSMASTYAVAIICIGAAAHQAWSANLFTTVSDMFPKRAVGSVTGIGAMAGGLGGVIVQKVAGGLTDAYKDTPQTAYLIMFVVCALSYLIAWGIMKILVPRHQPITEI
jgi:MFS family permease